MADARTQAARLIAKILNQQGSLSTLLPAASDTVDARDRGLLQELCYGVCRWQPRLNTYISQLLRKPLRSKDADIEALLLLGLYQLVYMRVPDHAALNATVSCAQTLKKPWAKKLINGVLRQFLREKQRLDQTLGDDPQYTTAHPSWLLGQIQQAWPGNWKAIVEENNQSPPFTLRINQTQNSRDTYLQALAEKNIDAFATQWSDVGITLKKAMPVNELPGFEAGGISVQDEAPQISATLLQSENGHRVLDACSAPGGKTAHLLEQDPGLSVVALDISETRMQRTRENLTRLGVSANCVVGDACQPSSWWDGELFDRILLDAPCSATGIIRRQPDIKILRNQESLTKLVNTQRDMLNALWPLLKPGGLLLYATCSILPIENAEQIEPFLQQHADAADQEIKAAWGEPQKFGRQLLPQTIGHDGFYFASLRKM